MINRTRHNIINNNARLATSHFFQYGLRSFAFLIFLCVTLFYIPLYTATLPPYHDHFENNRGDTGKKFSVSASKSRIKRTLDISVPMRVCFEIIAPSMEIGLHPPELVRSLCRRQIPPLLLVNGNSQKKQQNQKNGSQAEQHDEAVSSSSSNSSPLLLTTTKGAIRPQDRPYVQKVLRHFSSIVVLHDVAFTLYESTVKQLRQNCAQRKNVSDEKTQVIFENDDTDDDDEDASSSVSHHQHRHDETRFISDHYYHSLVSFIDFWTAEFPIAIFWAFMQNAEKFLRVVDAVNWLRLLPSLTFLSPQVRGGMITFYILSLIATFYYNNHDNNNDDNNNNNNNSNFVSFEDISWAFHFCALVVFMEWVSAVSDRFVVVQHQPHQQINNNNDNNQENEDTARLVIPVYLFASQYNRKVLAQECGYLLLQILVPPFVAGVVLSGLVALAVIVVH